MPGSLRNELECEEPVERKGMYGNKYVLWSNQRKRSNTLEYAFS